jgi:UDP-N-acetylmuramoyl-tripeptide--D-alanyl-D-alanine ligase
MKDPVEPVYEKLLPIGEISTDSRVITPGCTFFALKGDNFNGNEFAAAALEKGAAKVVTDEPERAAGERWIVVDNVLETLQSLASFHRRKMAVPVIAVTGTNGKTTTKELLHSVLSKSYSVISTKGNLNNHIGVPLTLLRIRKDTGIAVVEMGANHKGEIAELCRIAEPEYGIITNIGKAHLEGFGGFEGVISAKTELYRFISRSGGTLFVNHDNLLLMDHAGDSRRVTYGTSRSADCTGELLSHDPFVTLALQRSGEITNISSRLFGAYNFENIMAAACIGRHFGVSDDMIREAIEAYVPTNNRSQVKHGKRNLLILDAYNANPSSMEAALENFAASGYPNKMVILGDMLELGSSSEEEHINLVKLVKRLGFPGVILIGPVLHAIASGYGYLSFSTSAEAAGYLNAHTPDGCTILIKGSRGTRLEVVEEEL